MELLDGASLERVVSVRGAAPPGARRSTCSTQVACALVEAHEIGPHPPRRQAREHHPVPQAGSTTSPRWWTSAWSRTSSPPGTRPDPCRRHRGARRSTSRRRRSPRPSGRPAVRHLLAWGRSATSRSPGSTSSQGRTRWRCAATTSTRTPEPPSKRLGPPMPADLERARARLPREGPRPAPGERGRAARRAGGLDDLGHWGEREAREWWERWRRGRAERPPGVTARPTRTLDVALGHRGDTPT